MNDEAAAGRAEIASAESSLLRVREPGAPSSVVGRRPVDEHDRRSVTDGPIRDLGASAGQHGGPGLCVGGHLSTLHATSSLGTKHARTRSKSSATLSRHRNIAETRSCTPRAGWNRFEAAKEPGEAYADLSPRMVPWRTCSMKRERGCAGRRTDKMFRAIMNDIAGWTPQLHDRKLDQLALLIASMNPGQGPDLLGVCEVEKPIRRRPTRRQAERHIGCTSGLRGCSRRHRRCPRNRRCLCIYDNTLPKLSPPACRRVGASMKRCAVTPPRVQFIFKTTTAAAWTWAVFGNHWPSRSGGQFESRDIARLQARHSATPPARPGGTRTRDTCARDWGTSEMTRSTLRWFDMRSAPGSGPKSPRRARSRFCGI